MFSKNISEIRVRIPQETFGILFLYVDGDIVKYPLFIDILNAACAGDLSDKKY